MCIVYMQILCHFISGTWASTDFDFCLRSWNQSPTIPMDICTYWGNAAFGYLNVIFFLTSTCYLYSILTYFSFLLKLKKWMWLHLKFFFRSSSGTVFDDAFWLELNYLEVAKVAQSCAAHFTALLYAEIYADKKSMDDQERR